MTKTLCSVVLFLLSSAAFAFDDLCPAMLDMAKTVIMERDKGTPYEEILRHHPLLSGQSPLDPQALSYVRFASHHIYTSNMSSKDAVDYIMHDFCAVNPVSGY